MVTPCGSCGESGTRVMMIVVVQCGTIDTATATTATLSVGGIVHYGPAAGATVITKIIIVAGNTIVASAIVVTAIRVVIVISIMAVITVMRIVVVIIVVSYTMRSMAVYCSRLLLLLLLL